MGQLPLQNLPGALYNHQQPTFDDTLQELTLPSGLVTIRQQSIQSIHRF